MLILTYGCICIILAAACSLASPNDSKKITESTVTGNSEDHVITEIHSHIRRKRVIFSMGKAAGLFWTGVRAKNRLLSGTRNLSPGYYFKRGDKAKAKRDFDRAVDPESVMKYDLPDGGKGMWGQAGDRIIVLETDRRTGKAKIKIIKNLEQTDETTDVILYI